MGELHFGDNEIYFAVLLFGPLSRRCVETLGNRKLICFFDFTRADQTSYDSLYLGGTKVACNVDGIGVCLCVFF